MMKIRFGALLLGLGICLSGCGDKEEDGKKSYALVTTGAVGFWEICKKGGEDAGAELGVQVETLMPDGSTEQRKALEDLISAVRHESRSFAATLYLLVLALLISSSLIYVAEQDVQPEHFGSIPQAMWWTVVTLTTVGYGDIVPHTVAGKFIATLTALMGVCVVALLTGIVATGFTNQVAMRRQQLEAEISSALSDGVITTDEREKIDDLRQRLNITEEDALAIIGYLQRKKNQK